MQNPFRRIRGKRKRTVPFYTMWDNTIVALFKKKNSLHNIKPVRHYNIYNDSVALYSGRKNITYMYAIDGFSSDADINYRTYLRKYCQPGVRVHFVDNYEPHEINWRDNANKNKIKTWGAIDATQQEEQVDAYNYAENIAQMDKTSVRRDSLVYLADATISRERALFKAQTVMYVSGVRSNEFDVSVDKIEQAAAKSGIKLTRITGNLLDYIKNYSPFTLVKDSDITKTIGTNVLTDEILARFATYSQGKVGDGTTYWGSDIESSFPVLGEFKRNETDAENIVILAETGGGKSFMVKNLITQLLNRNDMVGTINDIEGDEYVTLGYLVAASEEVVILDLGAGSGSYFDPVEIVLTGDANLDDEMYNIAYSFTLAILKTLVGLKAGKAASTVEQQWMDQMITDGVEQFYSDIGIQANDKSTWLNSRGYRLNDVYQVIHEVDYNNQDFKRVRDLVIARLKPYFSGTGGRSSLFQEENRITIESIRTAKLVINSFGLKGKSEANMDSTQVDLMLLYAAQMSYMRSIFAFNQGKYNFKVWEEFQRFSKLSGEDGTTKNILVTSLTGGRKLGEISVLVSNRPSELLDKDPFGVLENYTSIAVGAIADEKIRKELVDRLSIPLIKKELDYIAKYSKKRDSNGFESELSSDEVEANPYAKAFFVYMNRDEYAICKPRLPKYIRESPLFKTGVDTERRNQV